MIFSPSEVTINKRVLIIMKKQIKRIPFLGRLALWCFQVSTGTKPSHFSGSKKYWEQRYQSGGNSGVGSYEYFAQFKADVLNLFVHRNDITSVIEFGCGDGNQLSLATYPEYKGFDVSQTAINMCITKFLADKSKAFKLMDDYSGETADLVLSLDVIYHLIEDAIFESYMQSLFKASNQYVILYSSNSDDNVDFKGTHVKHRNFTKWIDQHLVTWALLDKIPNKYPYSGDYKTGSFADFYIYRKIE